MVSHIILNNYSILLSSLLLLWILWLLLLLLQQLLLLLLGVHHRVLLTSLHLHVLLLLASHHHATLIGIDWPVLLGLRTVAFHIHTLILSLVLPISRIILLLLVHRLLHLSSSIVWRLLHILIVSWMHLLLWLVLHVSRCLHQEVLPLTHDQMVWLWRLWLYVHCLSGRGHWA